MLNRLSIPQISAVVFELVKVNIDQYAAKNYRAEQIQVVYLAVLPESIRYSLMSRDQIQKTENTTIVNKLSYSPQLVQLRGTFGKKPRLIAGSYLNGWDRLMQFKENIVKLSKESSLPNDPQRYIYALNFYDFQWQEFGSINIQSFDIRGEARENTQLPRYDITFYLIGDLIKAQSNDPLLFALQSLFVPGGIVSNVIGDVNQILGDASPFLQYATLPIDGLGAAVNLVTDAQSFVSGYANSNQGIYNNLASIF